MATQARPRRVLLAPYEVAGVAGAIRQGLRDRGIAADLWTVAAHPFRADQDRLVAGYARRAAAAVAAPLRYDVLHFHFGTTFAEFGDLLWRRIARRPIVLMHYHGDDCRLRLRYGMAPLGADAAWREAQQARERVIRRRLRLAGRLCDAAIVGDLELARYVVPHFRTVYVVPTALVLPAVPETPPAQPGPPVVFHAPSDQLTKGTAAITAAIDEVARRRPLRRAMISGRPHDEVLREIARADVVVDQLNQVTLGVLALEAMALGKPVLLQLDRALLAPAARAAPAVDVTADTLVRELERLVSDADHRARVGAAGPEYVRRVHAADRIAALIELVYADVPARRPGLFEVTPDGMRPLRCPAP